MYLDTCKYYWDKFLEVELLGPRECPLYSVMNLVSLSQSPSSYTLPWDPAVGICKLPFSDCLSSWLFLGGKGVHWLPGRYCQISLQNDCIGLNSHRQCKRGSLSLLTELFVCLNTAIGPQSRPSE